MPKLMTMALVLLSSTILPGVHTVHGADDSPYLIEKKKFRKSVRTVALAPLDVPDMFTLSAQMHQHLEAEATKALNKTRLKGVGIPVYQEIRTLFVQRVGGLRLDELDQKHRTAVLDHSKREMRLRHPVDAFAEMSLRAVSAAFADDRAEWDGVKRKVKSSGDGFSLFGGKNYQGSIAAASFQLAIYDRSDKLLYLQRGGIDVMQERRADKLVLREDNYLNDPKRLRKAVQMAFKPL